MTSLLLTDYYQISMTQVKNNKYGRLKLKCSFSLKVGKKISIKWLVFYKYHCAIAKK